MLTFFNHIKSVFYILIFLCFVLSPKIQAQHFIKLNPQTHHYPLGELVEILEDKSQKMTFEQVISEENSKNFKLSTQKHPNQGYSTSNFWFRIRIFNYTQEKWYLAFQTTNIDSLDVHFVNEKKELIKKYICGDTHPFDQRPIDFFKFVFPFPKMENFDIYVKFSGYYAKRHDLGIIHENVLLQEAQYTLGTIIFTIAIVLGLVIYNLLLYLSVKDKAYFYYVVYLFGLCIYMASINGVAFQFVYPSIPQITTFVPNVSIIVGMINALYFGYYFLKADELLPKIYKKIIDFLTIFGWLIALGIVVTPGWNPNLLLLLFNITAILVLVIAVFLITMGVHCFMKGSRPAMFFLIAWGTVVVSALIYVAHLFGFPISVDFSNATVRLGVISEAFILSFGLSDKIKNTEREKRKMQAENLKLVQEQNTMLEEKVTERTQQLSESNEELNQTNEELQVTLESLNNYKNELEVINKNVTDSIHYAQRIQASILPTYQEINQHLDENFILFKPRDIISGDFYYFQEINHKIIISAIDCTGHGVPGALMTMLANESLNEIIQNKKIIEADMILNDLHKHIRKTLKQAESNNKDGMDMVILIIDKENKKVEFAGAKNPLLYVQNNKMNQIKGDKMPIGGEQKEQERIFTKHVIDITEPTTFYLFTDGFIDQFGGKEKRKFMIANFRTLLLELSEKNMLTQRQTLERTFANWVVDGGEKQIDDVLVMGIKV